MVVPGGAIEQLVKAAKWEDKLETPPSSVASFVATIDDAKEGDKIKWKFHNFFSAEMMADEADGVMPKFTGKLDILVEPPEDEDPNDVPTSKWAAFPPPDPEYIPANYPELPLFSMCLEVPPPDSLSTNSQHSGDTMTGASNHSARH
jgi:hypothetical protein